MINGSHSIKVEKFQLSSRRCSWDFLLSSDVWNDKDDEKILDHKECYASGVLNRFVQSYAPVTSYLENTAELALHATKWKATRLLRRFSFNSFAASRTEGR